MRRLLPLTLLFLLGLTACGGGAATPSNPEGEQDAEVQLFAAASFGAVGDELIEAYRHENPGVQITATYAGSTQLVTQMDEGATPDLLITADQTTMDQALARVEDLAGASPEVIATNALVLATAPGNPASITGLKDLADPGVMTAICAQQVPCGALAHRALAHRGIEPAALTEEAHVSAVATKVATGQVDAGFIYSTDALAMSVTEDITVIDLPDLDRNAYPLALTTTGRNRQEVRDFTAWIATSVQAEQILVRYGFEPA